MNDEYDHAEAVVDFVTRFEQARSAYDRVLAVLYYCAHTMPGRGVDLTWICSAIERAGFGRPNITNTRERLHEQRGVRKKGANSHVMDLDTARKLADRMPPLETPRPDSPALVSAPPIRGSSSADVCIVCALVEPEFEAVRTSLGLEMEASSEDDPTVYYSARLAGAQGPITVVGAAASNMGLSASAVLAAKMILLRRPRLVVMPGIIGGTKLEGAGFGDIVVARQTIDYRSGKVSQDARGPLVFRGSPYPLPVETRLLNLLEQHRSEIEIALTRSKKKFHGDVPGTEAKVLFGDVASGDQVVSSAQVVREQLDSWRKLLGLEMETYAVHRACYDTIVPQPLFLSCKAISDRAEGKTDSWRRFAAYMSAEFVKHVVSAHFHTFRGMPVPSGTEQAAQQRLAPDESGSAAGSRR